MAIDDNSNHYMGMIIDTMRMNKYYAGKCSIVDEEPNTNAKRFFELLKDFNNHYGMSSHITINYSILYKYFSSSQKMS